MRPFFHVQTLAEVQARMRDLTPLPAEEVPLAEAGGRTLAADVTAARDIPGFARATMDGYAVRGRDTFGAGETAPGFLELAGEVVMGAAPAVTVGAGQCVRIGTGGMLPAGADAVIPVEHTRPMDARTVEVTRAVAPGTNVLGPRDEAAAGQVMLTRGTRLRAQDVGLLAALGVARAPVVRRPRVAILSTGDEVVPVEREPAPGQVRDVNTYTLQTLARDAGAAPLVMGLVGDDAGRLRAAVADARAAADLTLLSGGSSVGQRDLTADVFLSFPGAELLVHGVAVAPGKPFIWVRAGEHDLLGLPGQVASCLVAFHLFVEPMIERRLGREARSFTRFGAVTARLARNVPKAPGREEYVRVRLAGEGDARVAEPLAGKSGLLATLTQGQGLVRVPLAREGLDAGEEVTVLLFP
jgi:molybdopterin molybdotransferase